MNRSDLSDEKRCSEVFALQQLTPLPEAQSVDPITNASPNPTQVVPEISNLTHLRRIATEPPPSFAQSEFETIIRRQRPIPSHGLKIAHAPMNSHTIPNLDADWQFAGWGSISYLELTTQDLLDAEGRIAALPGPKLGQFRGTSIAGNGVFGSVFYAFPAVAATSSVFAPLALLIACLLLFLFRPILLELSRSARMNGANYTYLLQFSGKAMGVIGAAVTLFDALSTSSVSAATAAAYLSGEFNHLPVSQYVLAICIILLLTVMAFVSMRESVSLALTFTAIHFLCMTILMVAAIIHWLEHGSQVLSVNWALRPKGSLKIASAIFNGICLGFLSTTGFECTPAYIEEIRPQSYSSVLRNLLVGALFLNAPLMLLVYAILPGNEILSGANVLSIMGERVGGRWLRVMVVVDAMLVLAGGVLTGIFTVCGLLERLARDRVLPSIYLHRLAITAAPAASLLSFLVLSIALYASCGFSLSTASNLFSLSFLSVMGLYVISSFLLRSQRSRLAREGLVAVWTPVTALVVILVVLIGNIVPRPTVFAIFIGYLSAIGLCLSARSYELEILKLVMHLHHQLQFLHQYSLDKRIITRIRHLKRSPVFVWVNTDNIHALLEACLYVKNNEPTSRMVLLHTYDTSEAIPSELEANSKILDEAFPSITIDLVFVKGKFSPTIVNAVAGKFGVQLSSCFMFCPNPKKEWDLASYRGVRVIR